MKSQIVITIMLAALAAQAESSQGILFSSKKEVQEEPGPEKIVSMAQPSLVRFLETGIIDAQAQAALSALSQDKKNEGKSLERMTIDALKEINKK